MTSLNRVRYAVCILALALAAVFPLRATAADPYVFPVILSLTGGGGFLGQGEATTLRTMEAMVNKAGGIRGRPIKFDIADDTSNPQVTVQLVDQLIARNVPLILGATLTGTCGAEMPRVKEGGPVVMCLSPGVYPPPGSYMFTSNAWTVDEIHADIRYFRLRGMTKIGMITSTDGSGAAAEKGLNETFANTSIRPISACRHSSSAFGQRSRTTSSCGAPERRRGPSFAGLRRAVSTCPC
jgi:branched-chain amino acid transport system substrate-binding protein